MIETLAATGWLMAAWLAWKLRAIRNDTPARGTDGRFVKRQSAKNGGDSANG